MAKSLPWFPLWVDDLQHDEVYRSFSLTERGIFLELLCWQWREGSIPRRPKEVLVGIERARETDLRMIRNVLRKSFVPDGTGHRLVNRRLVEVQAAAIDRSDKARAKALLRHSRRSAGAQPEHSLGYAIQSQNQIQTQIKKSLSAHAEKATA